MRLGRAWPIKAHVQPGIKAWDLEPAVVVAPRFLLGAKIYINSATQYVANQYIGTSTLMYEGTVVQDFGYAERSMAAPAGVPRIGDGKLRLDDTDRRWRTLGATQTFLRRLVQIVRITDGTIIGGFEITKVSYGDGWMEIAFRDILSKTFNQKIPGLINHTNFPYLIAGVEEDFMPIIWGRQFSTGGSPQGKIRCPHIGQTTIGATPVDRYCLARFITYNGSFVVYRRNPGASSFSVVPAIEYTTTQSETLTVNAGSPNAVEYKPTYIDFYAVQDLKAEIRADSYGKDSIYSIGTGNIATASTDRNPIDFLSYMIGTEVVEMGGFNPPRTKDTHWSDVRAACAAALEYCDACIDTPITMGAFLAQWCSSFETDFFINRNYEYDVARVVATNANRPVLTEALDTISLTPETPDKFYNQWQYRFDLTTVTGEFAQSGSYNVTSDQTELGNVAYQGSASIAELQKVDLIYVSDAATALAVITRRSAYERMGSQRVTIVVDLPTWFSTLEIGSLFGVTDVFGLDAGGWTNKEFKCIGLKDDYGQLQTTVTGILRTPVTY